MTIGEIGQLVAIVLGSLGLLAAGIGTVIYGIKKSGRQERKDVTESADTISNFWKAQAEKLEEILKVKDIEFNQKLTETTKEFNEKIQTLTGKIGELSGQLQAEKMLNERLEKIFQNRSPEMEAFMKYMVEASEKHSETHAAMLGSLKDLHSIVIENKKILDSRAQTVKIEGEMTSQPTNL